jgi:adenylate cyclase
LDTKYFFQFEILNNFKDVKMKLKISFIALVFICFNVLLAENPLVDSLTYKLSKTTDPIEKVDLMNKLAFQLKSLSYFDEAFKLANNINYIRGIAENLCLQGLYFYSTNNFTKTLDLLNQSLDLFIQINDTLYISEIYQVLGYIYNYQGDFDNALSSYNRLNQFYIKSNDIKGISESFTNIGNVYLNKCSYYKALEMYYNSLKYSEEVHDSQSIANSYVNIGIINNILNKYIDAKTFSFRALAINQSLGNYESIANNLTNIAKIYRNEMKNDSAMYYLDTAYSYASIIDDKLIMANTYSERAHLYTIEEDYLKALDFYEKSLKLNEIINNKIGLGYNYTNIAKILIKHNSDLIRAKKLLMDGLEIAESTMDLELLKQTYEILINYYDRTGDVANAYKYSKPYLKIKDSLINIDIMKEASKLESRYEIEKETHDRQKQQEEKDKRQNIIIFASTTGSFMLIIFLFIVWRQSLKSEKLLLKIFPAAIAKRLKKKERYIADHFDEATVVFIDQVNFTFRSKDATPERVVEVLNNIYTEFDRIASKHGLEKIKTIGDCYMAVAGVPLTRPDHIEAAAVFALDIMKTMDGYNTGDGTIIRFKIGIDCGPVVAGVIGEKKFIYDLWGDTVNTASRMEEYGEPGKIQVTERFYQKLGIRNEELGINFDDRGEIEIKGKGMMRTYFLIGN